MKKEIDIGKVITELKKKSEMGFVSLDDVKKVLNNYSEEPESKQANVGEVVVRKMIESYKNR